MDLERQDKLLKPMLKVDSHQHFWIFDPLRDSWITTDMKNIRCDFLPDDLKPILERNNISACVAVQADQSETETRFLLGLAESNNFVKGVVGWVDLRSPDLESRLKHWKDFPVLKGFRHVIQAEGQGFMFDTDFVKGVAALSKYGFTFDLLLRSSQLREASKLVELNPTQHFVLDHLGKPPIKKAEIKEWARDIRELAVCGNVFCKLSGLVTEADLSNWKKEDFKPYLDIAIESFGVERVMFGSDWPVCKLAAEYEEVCEVISSYIGHLTLKEQELIWSGNAIKFYKLDIN